MKILPTLVGALLLAGSTFGQGVHATATATVEIQDAAKPYVQKSLYPLTTCVVSGEKLEGDDVKVFEVDGRTFKTCCGRCQKKVEADPATFAAKLDEAIVQQQIAAYPLDVCPVSGEKLGAMGEPAKLVLNDTLVQLCCKGCTKKAIAGADAIVRKIHDAAYEAQRASFPLTTCVVAGHELDDKAVDVMYGTTLVRFCCEDCTGKFEKDPASFLAKIAAARAPKHTDAPADVAEPHKDGGMAAAAAGGCCGTAKSAAGGCCGTTAAPKSQPVEKKKD